MLMSSLLAEAKLARYIALAEGVLVPLISGSTLVFVKIALGYLGPLTIAGLRYLLAFLLLLPLMLRARVVRRWPFPVWIRLFAIGLCFYVVGNGALAWGLKYIPATTGSLLLSLIPLLVLFAGLVWLQEVPSWSQTVGVVVGLAGSALFFSSGFKAGEPLGIAIVAIGLAGNATFGILGREIARYRRVDTLPLTAIPLAFGAGILLPIAFAVEGLPGFSAVGWGIVLGLAVIGTACLFLLYNHALRVLAAFEMSVMLNLTPLVTAFWAWLFLDERLGLAQIIGMVTVIAGVVLVQWRKQNP